MLYALVFSLFWASFTYMVGAALTHLSRSQREMGLAELAFALTCVASVAIAFREQDTLEEYSVLFATIGVVATVGGTGVLFWFRDTFTKERWQVIEHRQTHVLQVAGGLVGLAIGFFMFANSIAAAAPPEPYVA